MMTEILLTRLTDNGEQTTGHAVMYKGCKTLLNFTTLELSWKHNFMNISCIPMGTYSCELRTSEKYGKHLIVNDVEDRSMILIHSGNFNTQTRGCILVGEKLSYINSDKNIDITNSKKTLAKIIELIDNDNDIKLIINGGDNGVYNSKRNKVRKI